MQAQMNRMDVLSNNLANADTTAFKRDATASRAFTDELMQRIHGEQSNPVGMQRHGRHIGQFSSGVFVDEVYTDFTQGRLRNVHDPYTAAIEGPGFFAVSVALPTGEVATRYTRDGNFTLNPNGMLVTKDGGMVLDQNDMPVYISIADGDTAIGLRGEVLSGGNYITTLQLVDFEDYTTLRKVGNNYYDITEQTQQVVFTGAVIHMHVEDSNINAVREMIEIINVSRIYEANARFVQVMDTTLGKAVNDIARKG